VLLDECVDWRLSRDLLGHEVKTARQMDWSTIKNGELLTLAAQQFDVFVTVDPEPVVSAEPDLLRDRGRGDAGEQQPAGRASKARAGSP
jgi:hypothetical protein